MKRIVILLLARFVSLLPVFLPSIQAEQPKVVAVAWCPKRSDYEKDAKRALAILHEHKIFEVAGEGSAAMMINVPAGDAAEARRLLAESIKKEGLRITILPAAELNLGKVTLDRYQGSVLYEDPAEDGRSYRVTIVISKPTDAPAIAAERISAWLLTEAGKSLPLKRGPQEETLIGVGNSLGVSASAIFVFDRPVERDKLVAVVVAIDGEPKAFRLGKP